MAKYIDAEKLKAEITRLKGQLIRGSCAAQTVMETNCKDEAYNEVLAFIDSLQQEQPKQKKNCTGCPHCVDRKDQFGWHFKGCFGGPYNGKFIAEIDECPLKPEVDFEIGKYMTTNLLKKRNHSTGIFHLTQKDYATIASHFYELGKNSK